MSTLITKAELDDFEKQEEEWLRDEGSFDEFWGRKFEDEQLFFDWLRERAERTVNHFSQLTGLQASFYSKLMDMLQEAAMTGFFFGELRWNTDIRKMIEEATNSPEEK